MVAQRSSRTHWSPRSLAWWRCDRTALAPRVILLSPKRSRSVRLVGDECDHPTNAAAARRIPVPRQRSACSARWLTSRLASCARVLRSWGDYRPNGAGGSRKTRLEPRRGSSSSLQTVIRSRSRQARSARCRSSRSREWNLGSPSSVHSRKPSKSPKRSTIRPEILPVCYRSRSR
jgi:hypothetical protein